ncbi:MAG: D-alanine--D-alanine ligase [Alphaproteobacteria bacterium]|nr:D-alanine--D-alanine ligase [Alphaproteobacteria bacterium]
MRIGVTYDLRSDYRALGYGEEETAEFDAEETIAAICEALSGLGHQPERIGGIRRLTEKLAAGARWDAVFNICEGLKGVSREAQVPALLEAYDIPYLFSDPLTLALCLDKAMTKRVLRDAGVPTAAFALIESEADIAKVAMEFPLFLKPVSEGSGKGVDARSRVANRSELESVACDLLARFRQPVLVEEFLPGREFTVGITGTGEAASVLGVIEIVPTEKYVGHGYGLENKADWEDKLDIVPVDDADARAAADVALAAWKVLRCRDGGRADIRLDRDGRPCFIEVNPLAGIRPGYSDLCFIADFQKITYRELIGKFLDSFLARHAA